MNDVKIKRPRNLPAEVVALVRSLTKQTAAPSSLVGAAGEVIANDQLGSMGSPAAGALTLSATLADNTTTNLEMTTAAEVSKVHVEYDVAHDTYREAGAFDVVVISTNAYVVNKRRDDADTGKTVLKVTDADVNSGSLRLNLTVGNEGADADFKAVLTLVDAH